MLTIDILISVRNKRIVRTKEALPNPIDGVKYIICFQYTDEKYLNLIPEELGRYEDVTLIKRKETGLSRSRNLLLDIASSDLLYFIDDDTIILDDAIDRIRKVFDQHPDVDIALFQSQSYAGKSLRNFPTKEKGILRFKERFKVLTYEMVCRREKVQGILSFNTRFGLGSDQFDCFETQVFLEDALRDGLKLRYFPIPVIKTSALYKPRLVYVDKHVQRAYGALLSYVYNKRAIWKAFLYALDKSRKGRVHFFPFFKTIVQGILIEKRKRPKT